MEAHQLADKYHDRMSASYDTAREHTPLWANEQEAIQNYLSKFQPGSKVLDVPVGTGRFLNFYDTLKLRATGVDISISMLDEAQKKAAAQSLQIHLQEGDIFSLDFPDSAFNAVVCVRFMQWVNFADFERSLVEMARVSKDAVIVHVPQYKSFRDLNPFSFAGFCRLLRQLKLRFYLFRTRSDYVIHKKPQIEALLNRLDLKVIECNCVEPITSRNWSTGVEIAVYFLRK